MQRKGDEAGFLRSVLPRNLFVVRTFEPSFSSLSFSLLLSLARLNLLPGIRTVTKQLKSINV